MSFTEKQFQEMSAGITDPEKDISTSSPAFTEEQFQSMANAARGSVGGGGLSHIDIDPTKYDFNLKAGDFDNDLYRAQDQAWGTQLLHGIAKGVAKIPLQVIGNAAAIFDFEDYLNQDNEIGNQITRDMNTAQKGLDEMFPIYAERPGETLDVGDFAWWAENGSGLLSSAGAFAATGFGTGALISKGASALKWIAMATKSAKAVRAINAVEGTASTLTNALALNHAEGMLTAIDIYDESYKRAIEMGKNEDEAKAMAASAGAHSINVNRMNIALNMTSGAAFMKGVNKGLTRNILKKEAIGKTMFSEGVQEYAEEVINLYAEQEGQRIADYNIRGKNSDFVSDKVGSLTDTFFSLKGLEAGLLGAIGGVAQTGFTHLGNHVKIGGKSKAGEIDARIAQQQKQLKELDNIFKKAGTSNYETALSYLDKTSEIVKERDALLEQAEALDKEGKPVPNALANKVELLSEQIVAFQGLAAYKQGTTEHLINQYQELIGLSTEEAKARGFSGDQLNENSPAYYKKRAESAKKMIEEGEKIYQEHYMYKDLESIYVNRIAAKNLKKAIPEIDASINTAMLAAQEAYQNLPTFGTDTQISISQFDDIHPIERAGMTEEEKKEVTKRKKELTEERKNLTADQKKEISNQKRYITNARKIASVKAAEEANARLTNTKKELIKTEDRYKELISNAYQAEQALRERDEENDRKRKAAEKDVKDKAQADLATAQDDVATQEAGISENTSAEGVESASEDDETAAIMEGLTVSDAVVPEVTVETTPEQAIADKALAEYNAQEEKDAAANKESLEAVVEGQDFDEGGDHQASDEVQTTQDVEHVTEKARIEQEATASTFAIGWKATPDSEDTSELSENLNKDLLDFDKVNVGTKLIIKEDKSYEGNITYEGKSQKWQTLKADLKSKGLTQELMMHTPIVILNKDGEKLGYVHATNWITKKNLRDDSLNVKKEKEKLNALRKHVIEKGELATEVTHRSNGYFAKSKESKPLNEAMPGVKIAVMYKDGIRGATEEMGIEVNNLETIELLSGKKRGKKSGFTMALIPVNKVDDVVTHVAVPLLRQRLTQEARTSVVQAVKVFMSHKTRTDETSSKELAENERIKDEIKEATATSHPRFAGFDITTIDGLAGYIKFFTHTDRSLEGSLKAFMLNKDPKYHAINVSNIGVAFGKGGKPKKKAAYNVVDPNLYSSDPDGYLKILDSLLGDMYANVERDYIGTDKNVPIITKDGKVDSNYFNGSYDDYLAQKVLHTALRSHEIGTEEKPKKGYTLQSKIIFDVSEVESTTVIEQPPAVTATEPVDDAEVEVETEVEVAPNVEKSELKKEGKKIFKQINDLLARQELTAEYLSAEFSLDDRGVFEALRDAGWHLSDNINEIDFVAVRKNLVKNKEKKTLERFDKAIQLLTDTRKLVKKETKALNKKLEAIENQVKDLEKEVKKEVKKEETSDGLDNLINEFNAGIEFDDTVDSKEEEDDDDYQEMVATSNVGSITSDYAISTFTAREQSTLVTHMVANILRLADTQTKDGYVEKEFIEAVLRNTKGKYPNKLKKEGWKLNTLLRVKLQQVTDTVIKQDLETDSINNDEVKSVTNREEVWGEDILTRNPKSTLSTRLKRVLNFTQRVSPTGDLLYTKKGFPRYIGPDETYSTVINILSETYNAAQRQEVSFSAMMKTLSNNQDNYPFLAEVVRKLEAADRKTQYEFVVVANKHYVQMNFVMEGTSDKEGYYLNVFEDNANSKSQVVKAFWRENNLWVSDISNDLYPNMDVVKELQDKFEEWKKDQKYPQKELQTWLARIGLTVNAATLKSFRDKDNLVNGMSYNNHFTEVGGIFYELNDSLGQLNVKSELLESSLFTDSAVNRLANQEARFNAMFTSSSHRSGDKTIYSHTDHKYASERTAELLYNTELLTKLANAPGAKNSSWLKKLVKLDPKTGQIIFDPKTGQVTINKKSTFYKEFNFGYLGLTALKEYSAFTRGDKSLGNLSNAEHEKTKMGFFEAKGVVKNKVDRVVRFFFPTMSDKSAMFTTTAVAEEITFTSKGKLDASTVGMLYDTLVKPELDIIADFKPGQHNVMDYDVGAQLFYNIPEINNIPDLWEYSDIDPTVKTLNPTALIKGGEINKLIIKALVEHVDKVVDKQLDDWTKFGIYNKESGLLQLDNKYLEKHINKKYSPANVEESARIAAADYALNYMIANSNFNLLYVSDTAQYFKPPIFKADDTEVDSEGKALFVDPETGEAFKKGKLIPIGHPKYALAAVKETMLNVGKRLGGLQGSGYNGEYHDAKYKQGFITEPVSSSVVLTYLESLYGKNSPEYKAYKKIDGADAQEWITVPEKLGKLKSDGKINNKSYNNLMAKFNAGEDFLPEDLIEMKVFQPDKPIYVGAVYEGTSNFERKVYIKSSAMTLVPQFTRGLEIDKLRTAMEKQEISRVTVPTGIKTGNVESPLDIWEADGTGKQTGKIKDNLVFEDSQILELNRKDLRTQQDVPYKDKGIIGRVAQASKLAFVNILDKKGFKIDGREVNGKELQKEYLDNWDTLYKTSLFKLLKRLGIDPADKNWQPNKDELKKILQEEAEARNFSLQDIEGLTMLPDGSFELPLWAQGAGPQFESLLSSLVTNDIIKQEMPGNAYVLGSEEGFMSQETAEKKFGGLKGIVFTKDWTGRLLPSDMSKGRPNHQVLIPWPFRGLNMRDFVKDGELDLSLIDPELLEMYGMRIPNQGPNSTANMEVAGFLPEAMGDIIIAPRDFVKQMGSDFDVDKLYTYALNYLVDAEGKLARVTDKTYNRESLEKQVKKLETTIGQLELFGNHDSRIPKIKELKKRLENINRLLTENGLERAKAQDNVTLIHKSINANPDEDIQKQIRAPLEFGELDIAANRVIAARENDEDLFSPLSAGYQRMKYKNGAAGKDAISVFAIANTFNALAQVSEDDKVNGLYLYLDKNKKEPLRVRFGGQENKTGFLSAIKTLDGKTDISYNVSAYVSVSVDNEKAQVLHNLNINSHTFSTVNLLTQLGFTSDIVSSFMSQDILVDYVELIETHISKGVPASEARKFAYGDLVDDPKYAIPEIESPTDEETEKLSESVSQKLKDYGEMGAEDMYELIERGEETVDYKLKQQGILAKFESLQESAKELKAAASTSNIDGNGPGSNLLESLAREESVSNLFFNGRISNVMNLFGKTVPVDFKSKKNNKVYEDDPEYTRVGDLYLKPNTIAGFATFYGVVTNNKIWNKEKYFPYDTDPVRYAMDSIKSIMVKEEFSVFREERLSKQIFNGIKSYRLSDLEGLGLTQKGTVLDSATAARLILLGGKNNLQKIISENADTKFFKKHAFLNKLTVKKRWNGIPGSIKFDHRLEDNDAKLNVTTDMISMLNSNKELPKDIKFSNLNLQIETEADLVSALIVAQYASGGLQKYTQFLRFIPLDFLKKNGFTKAIRTTNFNTLLNEGKSSPKDKLSHFVVQFFQHNPELLYQAKTDAIYDEKIDATGLPTEFRIIAKEGEEWKVNPMVSIRDSENKKYVPYVYNGDKYTRLDNLGGVDFNEYQKGMTARSIVFENQARSLEYYEQEVGRTPANPVESKARNLSKEKLNIRYGLTGKEVTIQNTLKKISSNAQSPAQRALAEDYLRIIEESDTDYSLVIDNNLTSRGKHSTAKKEVTINPTLLGDEKYGGEADYARSILHEITHMLTVEVLKNPKTAAQKAAKRSLEKLFKAYQEEVGTSKIAKFKKEVAAAKKEGRPLNIEDAAVGEMLGKYYAGIDIYEFVASFMTDEVTRKYLDTTKFGKGRTYGSEIERRLLKILHARGLKDNTATAQGIREVIRLIEPDRNEENLHELAGSDNTTTSKLLNFIDRPTYGKSKGYSGVAPDEGGLKGAMDLNAAGTEGDYEGELPEGGLDDAIQLFPAAKSPDIDTFDLEDKIAEIIDNNEFIKLTADGTKYVNTKTKQEYERVTQYISEETVPDNELLRSSQTIGTKVDELVRDFFAGELKPLTEYDVSSDRQLAAFIKQLEALKAKLDANGETVLANDIVLYNDEIGVAGTVDLLTYDKEGNFKIYDMKTMKDNNFTSSYAGETVSKYLSTKFGDSKKVKHQKQLSMYRILLNNTHGVKATAIEVLPIQLEYNPGDNVSSKLKLLKNPIDLSTLNKVKEAELLPAATKISSFQKENVEEASEPVDETEKKEIKSSVEVKNPIINTKRNIIQDLEKKIARQRQRMHKSPNPAVRAVRQKNIDAAKLEIADLKQEIDALKNLEVYQELFDTGVLDLNYVDILLSQDTRLLNDEDLLIIERILDLWKTFPTSNFAKASDENEEHDDKFIELKNRAEKLDTLYYDVKVEKTKQFIRRQLGSKTTESRVLQILEAMDDVGVGTEFALDIGRVDSVVLQAISKAIQKTKNRTSEELAIMAEEIDPLVRNMRKALKSQGLTEEVFLQEDDEGRKTGRMVSLYTEGYHDTKRTKKKKAFSKEGTAEDRAAYKEWQKNNEMVIDPSKLSDSAYMAEITENVGAENAANIKKRALELQSYYETARETKIAALDQDTALTAGQRKDALNIWEIQYNPATYSTYKEGTAVEGGMKWAKESYVLTIPLRINKLGNETGYYDAKYTRIQQDEGLREFHEYVEGTLRKLRAFLPENKESINSIALMQQTFMEAFNGANGQAKLNLFGDSIRETARGGGIDQSYVADQLTEGRMLSSNFTRGMDRKKGDMLKLKEIQYTQEHGEAPDALMVAEWAKDITDELVSQSSPNLSEALKTYASIAIAYKHKSQVETPLRIAEQVLASVEEKTRGSSGNVLKDNENTPISDVGLKRMLGMLTSTLDHFYGNPKKTEGQFGKTKYTSEEKETLKEVEEALEKSNKVLKELDADIDSGKITEEAYKTAREEEQKNNNFLQQKKDSLGGKQSATGLARIFQGYMQTLGMGWNAMAGMANMGFGTIANLVEASGGQFFNTKEYMKAFMKVAVQIGGLKTKEAKKISTLMRRWGVLQKSSQEIFKTKTAKNKILNTLNPYKIQDSTEYINQAPLMVLMQEKTALVDAEGKPVILDGEAINWYNAYDLDGNWRAELGSEDNYQNQKDELKIVINSLIRTIHGNYDMDGAHLKIKDSVMGRMVSQFRSWMFEGFATRFEGEMRDDILGVTRKGRYITLFEQNLKLLSPGNIKNLSEIDKINARKLLAESLMYISLTTMITLLKGLSEDEEDEDKLAIMHTIINLSLRLQTDILFYINPADFEHLTKSAIPMASIVSNFTNFTGSAYTFIFNNDEDKIAGGVYYGQSKFKRAAFKVVPGLSAYQKVTSAGQQIFEKK